MKVLLKYYKRPDGPLSISTNIGQVLTEQKKEGGMESWIPGHPYPFPGMPDSIVVETLSVFKRIFPIIYKWGWISLRDRLPNYLKPQSQNPDIGLVDPERFSKPVREIHKSYTFIRSHEGEDQIEMRGKWTEKRDVECIYYEFDDTYRFREMFRILTMDWSKFRFTEADKYWASKKWKFDWGDFGEAKFKENIIKIYNQLNDENKTKTGNAN